MKKCSFLPSYFYVIRVFWVAWIKTNYYDCFKAICCFIIGICLSFVAIDQFVTMTVRHQIYEDIDTLPYRPYGLLLGTSKYFVNNTPNLYYVGRINATTELYQHDKVKYLLLSGDNRTPQYNEPRTMSRDLRKNGIPDTALFFDYAGFRTLDSIVRAKLVFHAEPMTIISQRFHCERALFIANYYHIDAQCFAAEHPKGYWRVRIREVFARVQMMWDLFIDTQPHFLGNPEPLPRV